MKRKVLVGSLLSALMSLSVIVGGTFALFTSKSETNIAISSGKVEVVASVSDLKTYSRDAQQEDGKFFNGGTATYENGVVDLSLITPGDRAEFTIKVVNNSNVKTKFRTKIEVLSGQELFKGLTVKIDDNVYGGDLIYSSWEDAVEGELLTTKVSVELPYEAGNEYQNLNTKFVFTVEAYQANADLPSTPVIVSNENVDKVNWTEENVSYVFKGIFDHPITISEIGKESTFTFSNVELNAPITLPDGAVVTGNNVVTAADKGIVSDGDVSFVDGTLKLTTTGNAIYLNGDDSILTFDNMDVESSNSIVVENFDKESGQIIVKDSRLYLPNKSNISVSSSNAVSNMTIENSWIDCGPIFVGGHVNNYKESVASLNIKNSYVFSRSTTLGAVISVWGANGVEASIEDSQVYVYNQGWHQSEDANGNSLFFEGANYINVNIQRSNMHLYGPHSVVRVRRYGSPSANISFDMNDSFIWTVSKDSSSGLSIDGNTAEGTTTTNIQNSILLRVRKVYKDGTSVDSEIIGNPTISGTLDVVSQSNWEHTLTLDNQVLTIAENAYISQYEGAAKITFELKGTAKIVVSENATFNNFTVVAADGYTLVKETNNGVTTYSVK